MIHAVTSGEQGSAGSPSLFEKSWVPSGYVGPVALPGSGRMVFWTGRIAIGLRYAQEAGADGSTWLEH